MGILTQCPRCLFTSDIAKIGENQCEYCDLQDKLRAAADPNAFGPILEKIRFSKTGQYDCLIGISGGADSSILLYMAVNVWRLNPLVIHFNNRSNRPEADNNMRVLTAKLRVNFIEYFVDQWEYDKLTDAFLMAGTPDADIPNDIAMAKLMYTTARQYGIKYILNGHDFAREGSSPSAWSYMDAEYVRSVYRSAWGVPLRNYPLYTFWDQIWSAVIGIKQIRPFHYMPDLDRKSVLDSLKIMGWQDYGGKHNENIYTAFVGNYLLPRKFRIDKRRTYLGAQMREGMIQRAAAEDVLQVPAEFNLDDLGVRKSHIVYLMNTSPIRPREMYGRYNFKRWKPVIWLLAKLKIVPYTFYVKYAQ